MRMSCNGCRVLRKGCSEDCSLRPCLQWIKSPDSQANATVFLAKFYGRAGLINLLNAGPPHLRPAIFKSLLHEACGRIINPIQGSVGLMWSGNWERCQEAVEAVLEGSPITQLTIDDESPDGEPEHIIKPLKSCDIRHLSKNPSNGVHKVRTRNRFKRSASSSAANEMADQVVAAEPIKFSITGWELEQKDELNRAPSHDSFDSGETVEPSLVNPDETGRVDEEMDLELTLGFNSEIYSQISAPAETSDRDV